MALLFLIIKLHPLATFCFANQIDRFVDETVKYQAVSTRVTFRMEIRTKTTTFGYHRIL